MSFIPSTMLAIAIRTPGPAQVLVPETRPTPVPGEGEILVRVHAAGINRPDILQREGAYPPPAGASDLPGLEIAGEIVARGSEAMKHLVGDKVCALVPGGGYAEYCLVHESNALKIPTGMKYTDAAGLPETYFTVWTNVFDRGRLKEGETFLVHGGTSGIGTTAIMLAKAFGARVFATAGSDDKCAACLKLGADLAINYRKQDFVAEVKNFTGGIGANLILDMVGGDYVQKNYAAAARDGRIVQIAFQKNSKVEIDMMPIMIKRLTHTGSTLRPRTVAEKAEIAEALYKEVWPLLEAGRCRPLIHAIFPLEEASKAHEMMESGTHTGKIILQVVPSH